MASKQDTPERQKEIYLSGLAGVRPKVPVAFDALEASARRRLSREAYAYIAGGAGREETITSNRQALDSIRILPRMFRDVSDRDTTTELFGSVLPSPLLLSPIGVLELAHRDADIAVAKAAAALGIPAIYSNQASVSMERCAAVMGNSPRWFQLYRSKSDALVESFLSRAQVCGCSAIVVTLDTTLLGWRPRDLELAYLPFLQGKGIAQYVSDPVFQSMLDQPPEEEQGKRRITFTTIGNLVKMVRRYPGGTFLTKLRSGRPMRAVRTFIETYSNSAITWEDLKFLRSCTSLPIVLKGILHPDDAMRAVDHGADGIIVSNHGGRQVDGAVPAIRALPGVVNAVRESVPVLMDSGIRTGADVFRALALGARAVCIGRPFVYGLALGGEAGVYSVIRNLMTEFELTMALSGCARLDEITVDRVSDIS